jgi:acyl-CoA dehydrogenase
MVEIWLLALLICVGTLSIKKASRSVWTVGMGTFLVLLTFLSGWHFGVLLLTWALVAVCFTPFYFPSLRYQFISKPILKFYRNVMPSMSRTEREALAAGTVGWEGELFQGNPNWSNLLKIPVPTLTTEEAEFLAGPVEILCSMIDDWDITHNRADLPETIWQFLKENGFFGLIIPKSYGGKEFSAYAHSQILVKVYSKSATVGTTIAVPNSLGPAELLLHYGTIAQKSFYLPRLATGEEIPCFALTGPEAGSDAGSMTDKGIICSREIDGKKVLGVVLTWDKRYITLAPVATVLGLAFKLYDPEHLLGEKEYLGITCALIPRTTPGVVIGRRHYTANIVFQNGPTQGTNVFVPMDCIIGGSAMAGQGWRMLMECLAAGRAISLPSSSLGGAKALTYMTGAYARIRRQFNVSIGYFEGISEVMARVAGLTYTMDATRTLTLGMIDAGAKPAVATAIAKYHTTELGRVVANDVMDIHGGKGICLGPKNYLGRFYQAVPIAITVEGANILTRSMIIFGQGAMRCHPYIFAELNAAQNPDEVVRLKLFDGALFSHAGYLFGNFFRAALSALTSGFLIPAPAGPNKRYFQQISRFSAAYAFIADIALLTLGGALKRKESLSARLGDILSYLYILSAILKHYIAQGSHTEDLALVNWSAQYYLHKVQESFIDFFDNLPQKWLRPILRILVFPFGKHFSKPNDALAKQVANLLLQPSETRARLGQDAYLTPVANNHAGQLEAALHAAIAAEPIEQVIRATLNKEQQGALTSIEQAEHALSMQAITAEQLAIVMAATKARVAVCAVDDFITADLQHNHQDH